MNFAFIIRTANNYEKQMTKFFERPEVVSEINGCYYQADWRRY